MSSIWSRSFDYFEPLPDGSSCSRRAMVPVINAANHDPSVRKYAYIFRLSLLLLLLLPLLMLALSLCCSYCCLCCCCGGIGGCRRTCHDVSSDHAVCDVAHVMGGASPSLRRSGRKLSRYERANNKHSNIPSCQPVACAPLLMQAAESLSEMIEFRPGGGSGSGNTGDGEEAGGRLRVVAGRDYDAQEQFFILYGRYSNAKLLYRCSPWN